MKEAHEIYASLQRRFALDRMRKREHVNELMVIYNMGSHCTSEDPLAIKYMMSIACGPERIIPVDFGVLGALLEELAAACALLDLDERHEH